MSGPSDRMLIAYYYDALDRLSGCMPAGRPHEMRFYQKERLVTERQGDDGIQFFQSRNELLAERHNRSDQCTSLLITDRQRSVLRVFDQSVAYTPYGYSPTAEGSASLLGFNGERADSTTGHYLLGNGHRAFSPRLMRFNRPDYLSPFGKGGLNGYAYCEGDPVNRSDPTGKWTVHGWLASALLELVNDYVVPYIPKRAVKWIPGVGNRTFGRIAKKTSKISAVVTAGAYIALNRYDAHAFVEPTYKKFFAGFLAISTVHTVSAAASTLHKIAIKGSEAALPILMRYRSGNALPTIAAGVPQSVVNHSPTPLREFPGRRVDQIRTRTASEIRADS